MHFDLATAGPADCVADICVVGSGAAGITLTRRLLEAGHTVILLESGGLDYEAATSSLNAGENVGEPYYDLEHSRLRFFGGTTAIWGGRIAELDPIDFDRRDWVPYSGWPFGYDQLRPYYDQARRLFGLPQRPPTTEEVRSAGIRLPGFDEKELSTKLWSFDLRANRFTFASCRDLAQHPRCSIVTHATVTSIESDAEARRVTSVQVRSLDGRRLSVHARVFVLAAGGIENPRLLLASRSVMPNGLGNAHDLVGRFFMEHPHARGGRIVARRTWALLKAFGRRHRVSGQTVAALLAPSPERQAAERILNTSLTVAPRQPANRSQFWGMRAYGRIQHELAPTHGARALWLSAKRVVSAAQFVVDPLRPWLLHRLGRLELALLVRAEQAPNPDSRVRLTAETDAAGVPRVALDWRLSELDIHSVERLVAILGRECERLGIGQVEPQPWLSEPQRRWRTDRLISAHPIGGYHHIGTTRMADDPRQGVTDGHGRVHGLANLYVAGSSLFPTSGWANPTFTIVALALRTADHISNRLQVDDVPEVAPSTAGGDGLLVNAKSF